MCFPIIFIHSLSKNSAGHLLSATHYVPGTVLGSSADIIRCIDHSLCPCQKTVSESQKIQNGKCTGDQGSRKAGHRQEMCSYNTCEECLKGTHCQRGRGRALWAGKRARTYSIDRERHGNRVSSRWGVAGEEAGRSFGIWTWYLVSPNSFHLKMHIKKE